MTEQPHADLSSVIVTLARFEGKLDSALSEQLRHATELGGLAVRVDHTEDRLTKAETRHSSERVHDRVTALEKRIWAWVGASSIGSAIGAAYVVPLINR